MIEFYRELEIAIDNTLYSQGYITKDWLIENYIKERFRYYIKWN